MEGEDPNPDKSTEETTSINPPEETEESTTTNTDDQEGTESPPPQPDPPATPQAPPPAAEAVQKGKIGEGDVAELARLKRENEELKQRKKSAEVRASQLEDENHRLKTPPSPAQQQKADWLDGFTFF